MYNYNQIPQNYNSFNNSNDRFVGGGFLGPFLLGGITGGLAAPLFYGGGYSYGRPNYYYNNYYYPYPPTYGPYYYR